MPPTWKGKTCTDCKTAKPFTDFYKKKTAKDGYQSQCKACNKIKQRLNPNKTAPSRQPKGELDPQLTEAERCAMYGAAISRMRRGGLISSQTHDEYMARVFSCPAQDT